jgi:amino acid adenylation domain-containing protein
VLLSRYSGQTDIVIGTPIANRHLTEVERLIGFFVNTLAIRTKFSSQDTFINLLQSVTQEALEAYEHQDVPFEKLVDALQIERDLSRSPIFQVMLVLQNANDTPGLSLPGVKITRAKQSYNIAKFDLALTLRETEDELVGVIEYNTDLFKETTIVRLSENFKVLLEGIVENPQQVIYQLPLLTEKEKKQILIDWNATEHEYPADKTIHQLFEEQVEKTPDSIALVFEDQQLTYRELNNRANELVHYLHTMGVKSNTLVVIAIDRSLHMIIGLLGILKIGAAYVPLDLSSPLDRLQFIINDVQAKFILTDKNNSSKIPTTTARVLVLNDGWQKIDQCLANNPIANPSPHTLAYVIYTSGTTGNPKGVMVEHRGVINTLISQFDYLDLKNKLGDLVTCGFFTNYAFDASVAIIFLPLISGYKLILSKELSAMDISEISNFIERNQINFINCAQILNLLKDDITSLKCLITGGEKPDKTVVENLLSRGISIYQEYGLTESSIISTYKKLESKEDISKIGLPIYNTKCYVLDHNLMPLPIGAKGELYISGVGLAKGYLNQPNLAAERFISNPFQTEEERLQSKNTKLYKTGDLVRWLASRDLEYIGRNDFQVKIRGYRVELGEIEAVLSSYEGIIRSTIIDKEHVNAQEELTGNKYLVGYYVSKSKIDEDKILNYLNSKLPDYMVPTALVHLYELPVNINGKLDRKALPAPCLVNKDEYLAPRNDLEVKICHIWADILELDKDKLGIRDDFFRLGGNSILAIKLVSRLNKQLSSNIGVSLIFKCNTIERLANYLKDHNEETVNIQSLTIVEKDKYLLSFAQERLWFIEKYEEGTNAYNISMIFNLKDTIKLDILEKSIRGIVSRHEVLRTLIKYNNDDQAYQLVLDDKDYPLNIVRVRINSREELDQELTRQVNYIFNLGNEHPIRVVIYHLHNKAEAGLSKYVLSILIHHIAFDGWSIDIFLKELEAHYHYYLSQSQGLTCTLNLPKLAIQYKDYALWQRNYLTGERLNNQISYWKNKLTDFEKLNLYIDKLRPSQINYLGKEVYFDLNESISIILRELAKEFKVSLYSLLLAGYYLTLSVYSNQNDIIIGTPIANRQYSQIEHLIGFFINSLALRTKHNPNYTIKEFIQMVGNEVVEAHAHQDLPFEKLVEELNIEKDITHHPIFDVWFEVQSFGGELYKQSSIETSLTNILEPYRAKFNLHKVAKFDLSVFIEDRENKLRGIFNYAESLYKEETIERFVNTYKTILTQIANVLTDQQTKQNFRIKELTYLTKQEQNLILNIWNNTSALYPQNKTINQLFEEQVERSPNDIAVMCIKNWEENGEQEEIKLTYKELNKKVNRLAHYLINKGVRNDTLVIVALERSIDAIIAFLAVLKAGGAYVPINPQEPQARIEHIFNDTKAPIIITNTTYADSLQSTFAQVICLDKILTEISNLPHTNLQIKYLKPTNLAYVIYTSGTSGKPKGVMIEHRGVINYTENVARHINIGIADKVDCSTNIGFDLTVTTTLSSLLLGASVILYNGDVRDIERYKKHLCINNINVIKLVPSYFELIVDILPQTQIKKIILGGEKLDKSIVRKVLDIYKCSNLNEYSLKIYDEYGPTETTVGSCISKVMVDANDNISLNIGKAYDNYATYVLSPYSLSLVPIGAIGELYIGGVGLARGYLNNPGLTSEKFITNPFQSEEEKADIEIYGRLGRNVRLYKTGDLVRWLPDGNLEYIGRTDFQVKIRGYRIECSEIEQALLTHSKIKQAVVTDYDSETGKQLVAYFIEDKEANLMPEELRQHLRKTLPEYMIPSIFMRLEALPLTVNGKLDRKALPNPEFGYKKDSYVPPRNELEQKICQIWAEVLGLDAQKISIYDDFFNLGGNSILAIKLVNKTNNNFQSHIKVSDIFVYKNIESLSTRIAQTKSDYQTVVKLNNTFDKTNIFMIHPGGGGCEQYTLLASSLVNDFSCYGIDPYNIYNKNKIDNLYELSEYYLSHIDEIMLKTNQKEYYLFGWSFGGKIALEIACILEKRGCTKIKVYLLDSFINDDYTISLMGNIDLEKRKSLYRNYLTLLGYENPYIERAILNYDIEYRMTHKQKVSSILKNTEIFLFKATLRHVNNEITTEEITKYQEYMITLEFNNIDKIHMNLNNIRLIKVNAYHENMLELRELIASKIIGKDLNPV